MVARVVEQFRNHLNLRRAQAHDEPRAHQAHRTQKRFAGSTRSKLMFTLLPYRKGFNLPQFESEQALIHWWIDWVFLRLNRRKKGGSIENQSL
jgi:hypothetical protein